MQDGMKKQPPRLPRFIYWANPTTRRKVTPLRWCLSATRSQPSKRQTCLMHPSIFCEAVGVRQNIEFTKGRPPPAYQVPRFVGLHEGGRQKEPASTRRAGRASARVGDWYLTATFTVVYDACVFIPGTASRPFDPFGYDTASPYGDGQIHDEWTRNLLADRRNDFTRERLDRIA